MSQTGRSPKTPHIASPEVLVDERLQEIRLYLHGVVERTPQLSKVGLSSDGLQFEIKPDIIACPYLRVFDLRNAYYGLAMPGILYKTKDGITNFEVRSK